MNELKFWMPSANLNFDNKNYVKRKIFLRQKKLNFN